MTTQALEFALMNPTLLLATLIVMAGIYKIYLKLGHPSRHPKAPEDEALKLWELESPQALSRRLTSGHVSLTMLDFAATQKLCNTEFRTDSLESSSLRLFSAYGELMAQPQSAPEVVGWYLIVQGRPEGWAVSACYSFWTGASWAGRAYPSLTADALGRTLKKPYTWSDSARHLPMQVALDNCYPVGYLTREPA